jgi:hypothetical protein
MKKSTKNEIDKEISQFLALSLSISRPNLLKRILTKSFISILTKKFNCRTL